MYKRQAEYSEERAEDFLFSSYECCFDFAALVGRKSDERLYYDDYLSLIHI